MNSVVPFARDSAGQSGRNAEDCRYEQLMEVLRDRATVREFDRGYRMPHGHIEKILDAAALAPSGANTQPWHYIVVTEQQMKRRIADQMVEDHARRDRSSGRPHKVDYAAMGHAPGFLVVLVDPRLTWAFPGLMDGSELDQPYHAHAERILVQSVAASTMAAQMAATALGYQTWWVSALGQEDARAAIGAMLGVPADLRITDFMLFGPALLPPERRWKKSRDQVASWDRFDMAGFRTVEQIDEWMRDLRRKAPPLALPNE
jgi:nitroreductase